jgi:hypothetical protein
MSIEKRSGKKGVVIREDKYGIDVLTTRNGYQWSSMPMDDELLDMLQEAITEFKAGRANVQIKEPRAASSIRSIRAAGVKGSK